ncbi:glycosyltransferase family 1 protein [soil metagenome]
MNINTLTDRGHRTRIARKSVNKSMDLVCFSHLRWDFVYQRPQHLLSRMTDTYRVFFVEEPIFEHGVFERLDVTTTAEGVNRVVPVLPEDLRHNTEPRYEILRNLMDGLFKQFAIQQYLFWYYTPMMVPFTSHFKPEVVVYDCMDELSAFKNAPEELKTFEKALLRAANVVFTGGHTLYQAKREHHDNIYPFPSSIDRVHFAQGREMLEDPEDQKYTRHPRLGFFGVIDERFDIALIGEMAKKRPDWHFVLIGPVVKIDPATLPQAANIHYLGMKSYQELPAYLAGWDIALIPFAINESTKYISPTKTPEYLTAGKPVISTPITDVVTPYGDVGLVQVGATADEFIAKAEKIMGMSLEERQKWLKEVDSFLSNSSWDDTVDQMKQLMAEASVKKNVIA